MIFNTFALTISFFVILIGFYKNINLLSPIFLTAMPWFLVFMVGIFVYDDYYQITEDVKWAWFIWFITTISIFFILNIKYRVNNLIKYKFRVVKFNYVYILIILIVWLMYRIWIVGTTGTEPFLLNLRLSSIELEGFEPLGLVSRFYPLVFTLFVFELCYKSESNKYKRLLLWTWMLLYAFATMGKFAILTPFLAWLVIISFQKKIDIKYLAYVFMVLFILMILMHFFRASDYYETTVIEVISIYIYSPIVALGYMPINLEIYGAQVFRFFYAVAYSFGIIDETPLKLIFEPINIPFTTNVYTTLRPYYNDFGLIGVFIGAIFFSLFFGIIFRLASQNIKFFQIIYALFSIAIIAQFFEELFISSLSAYIQLFICLLFIFLISKKEYHEY